jgi:hypothetical protein
LGIFDEERFEREIQRIAETQERHFGCRRTRGDGLSLICRIGRL